MLPVAVVLLAALTAVLVLDGGAGAAVVLLGGGRTGVAQILFDMLNDTMRAPGFGHRPRVRCYVQAQCQ